MIKALELALADNLIGPIRVHLDAQTAISRLQHTQPDPGQALALQAHALARKLQATSRSVTIHWVPGHRGVPDNKEADRAAKKTAGRPPTSKYTGISLAYIQRACSETARATKANWLTEKLAQQSQQAMGQAYHPPKGWKLNPIAADTYKRLASRYYQFKTRHAPIGTYLHRIKTQDSPRCLRCSRVETRVETPRISEQSPEARLFEDPKTTKALLAFIKAIREKEDYQQAEEQTCRADNWGIEALDEDERNGEG
ncbi:hypothetical protein PISL3812_09494 [Talaromyces islandicus]|uniref:RNase H type-1 domain-containing protein n=1 Tax=Talaromyces islandicus TaxID=28573 RepID=A0A0U1MA73_TALIS|nr:hypothetical protein PISL3812_09494 [Talaromyces islandicus]